MDTPFTVLERMDVPHTHVFSSDVNNVCRKYILDNFKPEKVYDTVFDRPLQCAPQLDLYVCGPPCTSASLLNRRQSESGRDAAYGVGHNCFQFIATARPYAFIVENVPTLKTVRGGDVLRTWLSMVDDGYDVQYASLNARHYGCPQNRNRLYIIGVRRDNPHGWSVRFPAPEILHIQASDLMNQGDDAPGLTNAQALDIAHLVPPDVDHIINIQNSRMHARLHGKWYGNNSVAACLTAKMPYMYSTRLGRRLTVVEMARLQGLHDTEIDATCRGLPRMLGNAMNAQVLQRVLESVFGVPASPASWPRSGSNIQCSTIAPWRRHRGPA